MESKRNCSYENYHKVYLKIKKARRVPEEKKKSKIQAH